MTQSPAPPRAPRGLGKPGKTLHRAVTSQFELDDWELILLVEICRQADRLQALADALQDAPLTTTNARGEEISHPLAVESRLLSAAFAKNLASLRLPQGDEGETRAQRRGGARGTYGLRVAQ